MIKNNTKKRITAISTDDLLTHIKNQKSIIIDLRPIEAYNGWKLHNEKRGGHIKDARSIPFKWSQYIDWIEIVKTKQIFPKDSLILYGYDSSQTEKVAQKFLRAGYPNIKIYHNFLSE